MSVPEVAEGLKEYIKSGSSTKRTASNQHSCEEGCLDHQIPIAAQCLEQVCLDGLDPVSAVQVALENNTIIEGSNITPTPDAVYVYRKDKRLNDQSKWLHKKNRSHNNWIYEMCHGVTGGCLSEYHMTSFELLYIIVVHLDQMIRVTSPPVGDFKVLWYLEDNETHVRRLLASGHYV
jgi:hypothetical protein